MCVYVLALDLRKGIAISLSLFIAAVILCALSSFSLFSQPCRIRIAARVEAERGRLPLCMRVSLVHT